MIVKLIRNLVFEVDVMLMLNVINEKIENSKKFKIVDDKIILCVICSKGLQKNSLVIKKVIKYLSVMIVNDLSEFSFIFINMYDMF